MTRRAWGLLVVALICIATVFAFNAAPAHAGEPVRYEYADDALAGPVELTPDVTVSRYTNVPRPRLLPTFGDRP